MPDKSSMSIAAALGSLPFPISKNAAIDRIGDRLIPCEPGDVAVPLASVLRGVPAERFDDYLQAARLVENRWSGLSRSLAAVARAESAAGRHARI